MRTPYLTYKRYYIKFEKYSDRTGHGFFNIRLYKDGERLGLGKTPETLELVQDEVIEVMIEQRGGNGCTGPAEKP